MEIEIISFCYELCLTLRLPYDTSTKHAVRSLLSLAFDDGKIGEETVGSSYILREESVSTQVLYF